jgi:inward rectifier potassium channel
MPLRDFYHWYLRQPWWIALVLIVTGYLFLNVAYAFAFVASGGITHARPGSFVDAFYFSVQTMGTIGYGAMYPSTTAANALVVSESVVGLVVTAVATGLVFTKFTQSSARVVFSHRAAISPMNGVPTLMVRIGNERSNLIMDTIVRAAIVRTERTLEGTTFYRMVDLVLARERAPALTRSWTVLHPITPESPLHGQSPEALQRDEVELNITIAGVDETTLQPVHARKTYNHDEILWGARHADILSDDPDGNVTLDLRRFHEVVATDPTEAFPYPRA